MGRGSEPWHRPPHPSRVNGETLREEPGMGERAGSAHSTAELGRGSAAMGRREQPHARAPCRLQMCATNSSHLQRLLAAGSAGAALARAAPGAAGKEGHPGTGLLATPKAAVGPCFGQGLVIQPGSQTTAVRHCLQDKLWRIKERTHQGLISPSSPKSFFHL